ncbi:MAG: hypothetical protein CMJ64_18275 [Planctomycetaceae bacterium]|nr:hypothetical protein [Planctomycetaceae bacterium]
MQLVDRLRAAERLDYDFLFQSEAIMGTTPNYETHKTTEYNFDHSTEREAGYKEAVSTRPGTRSDKNKRLHNSIHSGFKKGGSGHLALDDIDFGPLLSERLVAAVLEADRKRG